VLKNQYRPPVILLYCYEHAIYAGYSSQRSHSLTKMAPIHSDAASLRRREVQEAESSEDATILGMTPTTLAGVAIAACAILALIGWVIYRKVSRKYKAARNLVHKAKDAHKEIKAIPGNGESKRNNAKMVAEHATEVAKAYGEVKKPKRSR
jgi:hypothetical protein